MAEGFFNIAHRGGADLWPENTLPAFAAAIELGVDGIEFDLHLSQDGHLIVHHDLRLKADATRLNSAYITPPTPQIGELTRAELAKYDVGRLDPNSDYARRRPDQTPIDGAPIPDFSALCALIRDRAPAGFRLYAELKTALGDNADPAHMLADSFIDAIETSGLTAQSSVISFDWRCVNRVRAALPDIAHAFTTMPFERTDPKGALNPDDPKIFALVKQASAKGAPWWDDFDWREMDGDSHADKVLNAILLQKPRAGSAIGQILMRRAWLGRKTTSLPCRHGQSMRPPPCASLPIGALQRLLPTDPIYVGRFSRKEQRGFNTVRLARSQHHNHLPPFQLGHGFDFGDFLNIIADAVQHFHAEILVRHFAPAKPHGHFYLIAFIEEFVHIPHFHIIVMRVDIRTHFNFFDINCFLAFARFAGFFLFLIFQLAIIKDFANRRRGIWRNFHQIKPFFLGHSQCRVCINNALFFAISANQQHLWHFNQMVHTRPGSGGQRGGGSANYGFAPFLFAHQAFARLRLKPLEPNWRKSTPKLRLPPFHKVNKPRRAWPDQKPQKRQRGRHGLIDTVKMAP